MHIVRNATSGDNLIPTYVHLVNYTKEGAETIEEVPDRMERVEQAAAPVDARYEF